MIYLFIIIVPLVLVSLVLTKQLVRLKAGNRRVAAEIAAASCGRLEGLGSVRSLRILPLVDYYTDDPGLKTEAGVSYLVRADNTDILLDVGFNKNREHPSPLLHNAGKLDVSFDGLSALFISHLHLDHVGGMEEQRRARFSISRGPVALPVVPVYAPAAVSPSDWNPGPIPQVIQAPRKLAEGMASIGIIPRSLFLLGYTLEHSLAVNVEGKGIVLIIGCGHQTIERIIERTRALFAEPIYGIVGGLHFPVRGGRIKIGPVNLQNLVGSDRPPWKALNTGDVERAIEAIQAVDPQIIALSPHDSSDWSLNRFREVFKDRCLDLKVGRPIEF